MADEAFGFSQDGARRVIAATKAHENQTLTTVRHPDAPNRPQFDRCVIVRVQGTGSTGTLQTHDGSNLFPGTIETIDATQSTSTGSCYVDNTTCKILVTNPIGSAPQLKKGDLYVGRQSGVVSGGVPLVIIDVTASVADIIYRFKLTATLSLGSSAAADLYTWSSGAWTDTGTSITVVDWFGALGDPGEWQAPSGYYGYAVKLSDKNEYQVLYMEHQASFAEATTSGTMSGGSAAATLSPFWDGRSTAGATTIYDTLNFFNGKASGTKFIVKWDNKRGQYVIVYGPPGVGGNDLIPVYLNADLARGGSAGGTVKIWVTSAWTATGASVTVYDPMNMGPASTQDVVWCLPSQLSGRLEVVSTPGAHVLVKVNGDTAPAGTAASCPVWTGTPGSESANGATVSVVNWGKGYLFDTERAIALCTNTGFYFVSPPGLFHSAKINSDIAKGSSGSVTIYKNGSATSFTSVTAITRQGAVKSGKWCTIAWDGYEWVIVSVEC